jgi:hypothetical protein
MAALLNIYKENINTNKVAFILKGQSHENVEIRVWDVSLDPTKNSY